MIFLVKLDLFEFVKQDVGLIFVRSYMTGMLTSSYDIAAMILTPLISYIGGSRKKPAFCAWGLFTMGVGFFIFMLPHFVSPPYQAGKCL